MKCKVADKREGTLALGTTIDTYMLQPSYTMLMLFDSRTFCSFIYSVKVITLRPRLKPFPFAFSILPDLHYGSRVRCVRLELFAVIEQARTHHRQNSK